MIAWGILQLWLGVDSPRRMKGLHRFLRVAAPFWGIAPLVAGVLFADIHWGERPGELEEWARPLGGLFATAVPASALSTSDRRESLMKSVRQSVDGLPRWSGQLVLAGVIIFTF